MWLFGTENVALTMKMLILSKYTTNYFLNILPITELFYFG